MAVPYYVFEFDPDDAFVMVRVRAGNGRCKCSKCMCNVGFSGQRCECQTDNSTCIDPVSNVSFCFSSCCKCSYHSINLCECEWDSRTKL